MTSQTCSLPGCSNPIARSRSSSGASHLTCGEFHHLLLMAARFNPALPPAHEALLDRNGRGLCGLLSCSRSLWPGHSFCSRVHYLIWLADFCRGLSQDQICLLPNCPRHVYVDEPRDDASPPHAHQFCGWRHCQKFTMLNALQAHKQQQQQTPPSPPLPSERNYGHVPSVKSFICALKNFALTDVTPKNIKVDEDFFTRHPWEVLTEGDSCFLIARCNFLSQNNTKNKSLNRNRGTRDHYHWKQQGKPVEKDGFSKKYFTYERLKAKKKGADQFHDVSLYKMKEYTVEAVKSYCLIKLCKRQSIVSVKQRNVGVEAGSFSGLDHASDDMPDDVNQKIDSLEESSVNSSIYDELPLIMDLSILGMHWAYPT